MRGGGRRRSATAPTSGRGGGGPSRARCTLPSSVGVDTSGRSATVETARGILSVIEEGAEQAKAPRDQSRDRAITAMENGRQSSGEPDVEAIARPPEPFCFELV